MRKLFTFIALLTLSVGMWAQTQFVTYIDENGDEQTVDNVNVITNSTTTLNAGWYVVKGTDVRTGSLTCNGEVHLILADGAKLTATGGDYQAGIQVSGEGNSLSIYGQAAQSGRLIATGGEFAAGIGGGLYGSGSNITINGAKVTATTGGAYGAGIGGGGRGAGTNIIINGGTVTAEGEDKSTAIGIREGEYQHSVVKVATSLLVKADNSNPPTTLIENNGGDIASKLEGKRYAVVVDLAPIKAAAIEEIDFAIEGVTDENILAIANTAKTNIGNATTEEAINSIKTLALAKINALYLILIARQGIQNAEINSMINDAVNIISNATDTERITDTMLDAMTVIGLFQNGKAEGIEQGRAEAFGSMGEPCTDCPAIEVKKGDKIVKLYNPEKVEFKKE